MFCVSFLYFTCNKRSIEEFRKVQKNTLQHVLFNDTHPVKVRKVGCRVSLTTHVFFVSGNEENSKPRDLLISTEETVDKEILAMYFEQFTEKAEIIKHGKNKWILKVANSCGKF